MKILIIGDANHQHIRNKVKWLVLSESENIKVDVFNISVKNSDFQYYSHVYQGYADSFLLKIKGIRRYYRTYKIASNFKKITTHYDVIHIHYISQDYLRLMKCLKKIGVKIVLSVWGSDFYRTTDKRKDKLKKLYQLADRITFSNIATQEAFQEYYNLDQKKYHINRWGIEPLEQLYLITSQTPIESKKRLGLDPHNVAVTIGYNYNRLQQHLKIIDLLTHDMRFNNIKKSIQLIFPLTYGNDLNYKRELIDVIKSMNFNTVILENYISDIDIAYLRKATDIFVQLQLSDQFSGSTQEHLFAGSVVITGSWLPYGTFSNFGIYFKSIDSLAQLPDVLYDTIENLPSELGKSISNAAPIFALSSMKECNKNWLELYKELDQ